MARDRSIKLIIQAQVDGAKRALRETAEAARKVGDESESSSKRASTAGERLVQSARNNSAEWTTAGTAIAGAGALLTAGVGAAVGASANFEKAMSGVKAVTNASASEMDALTQSALDMGAQTVFSASEAAVAQGELARAGVSTADILGGALKGSMDLAAAGGLELADAAVISAQAMNLFNLEGDQVGHIADVLASGANKSAADVADLGQAMQQAGTVASQTGLSLEETVAALSMFADSGIRGSDAGTSLKTMLQRLTPQSKESREAMEELGFSAFDAAGNFIGLEGLAAELESSFGGLDTESRNAALGVIFGSDAIRGAQIIMEGGAEAAREYEAAMNDQGAAARMAATQMDNLAGDWEEFTGALETALIQGGTSANGLLRGLVSGATDVVNAYNELPPAIQGGITIIGGIAGVAALATGGLMVLVPKAVETYDAFQRIAEISPRTADGLGKVAKVSATGGVLVVGLTAVATGLQMITQASWESAPGVEEVTRALLDLRDAGQNTGSLDELIRGMNIQANGVLSEFDDGINSVADAINRLDNPNAVQRMEDLDKVIPGVKNSADRAAEALGAVDSALERMVAQGDVAGAQEALAAALEGTGISAATALEHLPLYRDALIGLENDAKAAAESGGQLGEMLTRASGKFREAGAEMRAELEEQNEELQEWQEKVSETLSSFTSWSDALSATQQASKDWATAQAAATEDATDSWEDYYDGQSVNVADWLTELEAMTQAQEDWATNMMVLAGRVSPAVLAELEAMGAQGAPLVAELVDASEEEIARLEAVLASGARDGVGGFVNTFTDPQYHAVMAAAFETLGEKAYLALADKLTSGEITLQQAIDKYDLKVDLDADPTNFGLTLGQTIGTANESVGTVTIAADDALGQGVRLGFVRDIDNSEGTVDLKGDDKPGQRTRTGFLDDINRSSGTVDIRGTAAGEGLGNSALNQFVIRINNADGTVDVYADTSSADTSMVKFFQRHDGKSIKVGMDYSFNSGGGYANGGIVQRANGGLDDAGRYVTRLPMMGGPAFGRTNIMWGEPETGWEAYISGRPGMEQRNRAILGEAARRLGMSVVDESQRFARGGFTDGLTAKFHQNTEPSKFTDALERAAARWLGSLGGGVNYGGAYGWAPNGMRWQQIWARAKAVAPEAVLTSAYRPGAITASGVPSLHGQGRAIDVVSSNMRATFMKLLAAFGPIASQLFYTPMGALQKGYRDANVARDHWDHIHLGVAKGGIFEALKNPKVADTGFTTLRPGWNATYNGLGRDEHMVDVAKLASVPARTGDLSLSRGDLDYLADRINRGAIDAAVRGAQAQQRLGRMN